MKKQLRQLSLVGLAQIGCALEGAEYCVDAEEERRARPRTIISDNSALYVYTDKLRKEWFNQYLRELRLRDEELKTSVTKGGPWGT